MLAKVSMWCFASALVLGLPMTAHAQPADGRTYFTFSNPVEVPGATLPPGKYVFRRPSPETSHNVVQVLSADNKKVFGMFYSLPIERSEAPKDPEVRFMENAAGVPPAVRTWWTAGERTGYEFVYPKQQARRLARASREPVLTTQAQTTKTAETDTRDLARVSSTGDETKVDSSARSASSTPSGVASQGQVADSAQSASRTRVPESVTARRELPQTASTVPLEALGGVIVLLSAFAIRGRRREEL